MPRRLIRTGLLLLLAVCPACNSGPTSTTAATEALAHFHSFPFTLELQNLDGKKISLADYRGKVVIVDLWGTWCPPCREEIPHLVDLYKKYHRDGLDIIGVNIERLSGQAAHKAIRKAIADLQIPYECVLGDNRTQRQVPGLEGYPTTLFIDRTGKVRFMFSGYAPESAIESIVAVLLAERPPA